ncbi:MAG: hypothetical protein H0X33_00575 [Taibaiella sp.]|nr:hypothetical protein [Taibaiella sp.]
MKSKSYLLIVLLGLMASCQRDKREMLVQNWHAVALDNPQMNVLVAQQQQFIDTVGKGTDVATNLATYGTTNMDSFKKDLQIQLDSFKMLQQQTLTDTWFNFKKNGTAILTFNGVDNKSKWYFDDEGNLILDEIKEKSTSDHLKMNMIELNDTLLKLKFTQQGQESIVTFVPGKK